MSDQGPAGTPAGTSRRVSLVGVVVAGTAFVVLAAVLIPWHWLPGQHVEAVPPGSFFTPAEIDKAEHVSGLFRYSSWANLALGLAVALVLGFSRTGSRLVGRLPGRWWLQGALAVFALTAITVLVQLPLAAFGHHVERHYQLSSQPWGAWLSDQLISALVAAVFTGIGVIVLLALIRRAPRSWPAWAAGA